MNFPDPTLPPFLIVDDCDDDTFLLRHRLRAGGIANPIESFESIDDAWRRLSIHGPEDRAPGLMFVDIKMPGASGFDLIARVRSDPSWNDLKIVVATSSNHPADVERALQLGIAGYLIKFPPPDVLAEFLREGPWFSLPHCEYSARHALSA